MMLLIIGFNLTVYKYIRVQQCYVLIIVIISILINKGFKSQSYNFEVH